MESSCRSAFGLMTIVLGASLLAACGDAIRGTSGGNPTERDAASERRTSTIRLQLDAEPSFGRPESVHPYGRIPELTLYGDGTLIYVDEGGGPVGHTERAMRVRLEPEEADALVGRVEALGFGGLQSHLDDCQIAPNGRGLCVSHAA